MDGNTNNPGLPLYIGPSVAPSAPRTGTVEGGNTRCYSCKLDTATYTTTRLYTTELDGIYTERPAIENNNYQSN